MLARIESPERIIYCMAEPGKRMPVAGIKGGQHPLKRLHIQGTDMLVIDDIKRIIPVHKTVSRGRKVDEKCDEKNQDGCDPHSILVLMRKPFLHIHFSLVRCLILLAAVLRGRNRCPATDRLQIVLGHGKTEPPRLNGIPVGCLIVLLHGQEATHIVIDIGI